MGKLSLIHIYKIIDDNGFVSIIADYWNLAFSGPGAVLDCKGDYISPQTSTAVVLQKKHFTDDFEILDKTRLVSYNSTGGAHGAVSYTHLDVYKRQSSGRLLKQVQQGKSLLFLLQYTVKVVANYDEFRISERHSTH